MSILGIDEVGRGPWAGPLVVGAVVLADVNADWCEALADSKKLTPKKRKELSKVILEKAAATGLGWVSSKELDELGMTRALCLAARRAVFNIKAPFSEVIIDGTMNFLVGTKYEGISTVLVKADSKIKAVSAASIIAKVARDEYMVELAEKYPEYGFEKHKGYGTAIHQKALKEFGPCPEHRRSFKPVGKKNTTALGSKAEGIVADYLRNNGHKILARNHKTPFYEIDIISVKDDKIYFTEVKYRKNSSHGSPLDAITPEKQKQMTFAAQAFLKYQPGLARDFSPLLAVAAVSGDNYHIDNWFPLELPM